MLINKKSNLKINDLINFDEAKELSKAPLTNALIQNSFTTKKGCRLDSASDNDRREYSKSVSIF